MKEQNSMDCRHVKKLLDDYFDKTLSSREQDSVEEHLVSCAKCREEYSRMERLIAFLRDTVSPDALPSPDFFNEVLARAHEERGKGALPAETTPFGRRLRNFFDAVVGRPTFLRLAESIALVLFGFIIASGIFKQEERPSVDITPNHRVNQANLPVETVAQATPAPTPVKPTVGEPVLNKSRVTDMEMAFKEADNPNASSLTPYANFQSWPPAGSNFTSLEDTRLRLVASPERQSDVIESIQRLKLNLYLSGESRFIPDIHKMERFVADIASATQEADNIYLNNLKTFQEAEQCLVDKKYLCAIQNYSTVSDRAPGSLMSFLGEFQAANVNYEQIGDYKAALTHYQKCIENYPSHYLTEDKKEFILKRIDLLTRNSADDWRPLKIYLKAKNRDVAFDQSLTLLKQLITDYPKCSLVRDAADALSFKIINGEDVSVSTAEDLIAFFQQCRERFEEKDLQQIFQFKTAEIFHQKMLNYPQAILEYNRVVEIDALSDLAEKARGRINTLYNYGVRFR